MRLALRNLLDFTQTFGSAFFIETGQSFNDTVTFNTIKDDLMPCRIVSQVWRKLPE
jgi:hypothetical protein